MDRSTHSCLDPEQWQHVQLTRQAIRARATLLCYTLAAGLPFIALSVGGACLCGLPLYQITAIAGYHTMLTLLFIFDSLRNAAHACFVEACDQGLVDIREGIPVVDRACRNRHLARLSFAIGGQPSCGEGGLR
ncbi:hypothetical protein [Geobacter sp. SVR]|uniref:hypothetical protein n=1 Tax=Geobacter sp. SVR TaxID=2495594 RepID=UPI001567328B|nr:hypothetical protein [Geobacter sp. SVR]